MKKNIYYSIVGFFFVTICLVSCKEEGNNYYLDPEAPAPTQISDLKVLNTPGGATITYKIPKDKNLSYVKAVYEIQPGVFRDAKSSYYKDTLNLVGFGDTLTHRVEIFSVGRNEKMSEPISVNVKPLTPPIQSVFESLTLDATFGGVNVTFKNDNKADLAIFVMMEDTTGLGEWIPLSTHYSAAREGEFAARGLDPKEYNFAIYVRDRWNNKSDTLIKKLTPFYEELIPKTPFRALHLDGDSWEGEAAKYRLENVWDDIVNNGENIFASKNVTVPQWFTVDLGQTVVFSRMKLYQRTSHPYHAVWIKKFEIWGSNDFAADDWVLLGQFDSLIPSGSVWPNYTADDMVYQREGEDFTFVQPVPAIRYMRFRVVQSYGGSKYQFCEFTFWGQIIE